MGCGVVAAQKAPRVAVHDAGEGRADLAALRVDDPRVGAARSLLGAARVFDAGLHRDVSIALEGERQIGPVRSAVFLRQPSRGIGRRRARQRHRLLGQSLDLADRQIAGRCDGRAQARFASVAHQRADPQTALVGLLDEFDLLAADAGLHGVVLHQNGISLCRAGAAGRLERTGDDFLCDFGCAHPAVPPTVSWSIRKVGSPTPTGTL